MHATKRNTDGRLHMLSNPDNNNRFSSSHGNLNEERRRNSHDNNCDDFSYINKSRNSHSKLLRPIHTVLSFQLQVLSSHIARVLLSFLFVNLFFEQPVPPDVIRRTWDGSDSPSTGRCGSITADAKVLATQMSQRIVVTQYGRLRGILVSFPERRLPDVEAYLGLEYASLLGGELRFMPPTSPVGRWDGVRTAHKFKPVCPQRLPLTGAPGEPPLEAQMPRRRAEQLRRLVPFLDRQQEDCLSLNIYVPVRGRNETGLYPVVLFVHGETYSTGSGNAYDGSVMASYGRVIVITMNYRLGVLGFLTTGDGHAPGNYGLLDQVAALRWIADNIEPFGGDRGKVTLLGHGHGAAMVNILLLSPVTRGKNYFHRVIISSGSAFSPWAITSPLKISSATTSASASSTSTSTSPSESNNDLSRYTRRLADLVNCSSTSNPAHPQTQPSHVLLMQCLQTTSYEELVNADVTAPKYFAPFGPSVDGLTVLPRPVSVLVDDACAGDTSSSWTSTKLTRSMRSSGDLVGSASPAVSSAATTAVQAAAVPVLAGVVAYEGYRYFAEADLLPMSESGSSGSTPSTVAPSAGTNSGNSSTSRSGGRSAALLRTYIQNVFRFHQQKIYDILAHNYNDWESTLGVLKTSSLPVGGDRGRIPASLVELIGDGLITAPMIRFLQKLVNCSRIDSTKLLDKSGKTSFHPGTKSPTVIDPVYFYTFGRPSVSPLTPGTREGQESTVDWANERAVSGEELQYVLGAPLVDGIDPFPASAHEYSEYDKILSETVLRYWTNFIKTGNPNLGDSAITHKDRIGNRTDVKWLPYNFEKQQYLLIGAGENGVTTSMEHHYKSRKMALWLDLLPKIHRARRPSIRPGTQEVDLAATLREERRLHLLDDYTDPSTFEVVGTREIDLDDLLADNNDYDIPSSTTLTFFSPSPVLINGDQLGVRRIANTSTTATYDVRHTPVSPPRRDQSRIRPTSKIRPGVTPSSQPRGHSSVIDTGDDDSSMPNDDYDVKADVVLVSDRDDDILGQHGDQKRSSSLGVTLAIGGALLALNVGVFLATFCQWRRARSVRGAGHRARKMAREISRSAAADTCTIAGTGDADFAAVDVKAMTPAIIAEFQALNYCDHNNIHCDPDKHFPLTGNDINNCRNHGDFQILDFDRNCGGLANDNQHGTDNKHDVTATQDNKTHNTNNCYNRRRSLELSQTDLFLVTDVVDARRSTSPCRTFATFLDPAVSTSSSPSRGVLVGRGGGWVGLLGDGRGSLPRTMGNHDGFVVTQGGTSPCRTMPKLPLTGSIQSEGSPPPPPPPSLYRPAGTITVIDDVNTDELCVEMGNHHIYSTTVV